MTFVYMGLSFSHAKVFHWVPLTQLQGKQAAENEKNRYSKGEKLFQMQFETRQRVNKRQNKVVPGGGAAEEKTLTQHG